MLDYQHINFLSAEVGLTAHLKQSNIESLEIPCTRALVMTSLILPKCKCWQNVEEYEYFDLNDFATLTFAMKNSLYSIHMLFPLEKKELLLNKFQSIEKENLNVIDLKIWCEFALEILKDYRRVYDTEMFNDWKNIITTYLYKICNEQFQIQKNENILKDLSDLELPKDKENLQSFIADCFNSLFYEEGLFYINLIDEKQLDELLEKWQPEICKNPKPLWLIRKAFLLKCFLGRFDNKNSKTDEVNALFKKAERTKTSLQERLWILELYLYNNYMNRGEDEQRIKNEIAELKKLDYYELSSVSDYLLEKSESHSERQEKNKLSEDYRYSGRTTTLGITAEYTNYIKSIQLLNLLETAGLPPTANNVNWTNMSSDIWIDKYIETQGFEKPRMLSYSFVYFDQSADEDISRKMIRSIIFDHNIKHELIKYLFDKFTEMFKYRLDHGNQIRHLLFPIAELIRAMKFEDWKDFACTLINELNKDESHVSFRILRGNVWGWLKPFLKIISLIEDQEMLKKLFIFFFEHTTQDEDLNDKYLRSLVSNQIFRNNSESFFSEDNITELILNDVTNNNSQKTIFFYHYMPKTLKNEIINKLNNTDYTTWKNDKLGVLDLSVEQPLPFSGEVINDLVKKYPKNSSIKRIKEKIFKKTKAMPLQETPMFPLDSYFREFPLDDNDVKEIFSILQDRKTEILNVNDNSLFVRGYKKANLRIVSCFLIRFQDFLIKMNKDGFASLKNEINKELYPNKEFLAAFDWVYSDNKEEFKQKANEILCSIYNNEHCSVPCIWNAMVGKLIFNDSPHLESVLESVSAIIAKYINNDGHFVKDDVNSYFLLLGKYKSSIPNNMDRIFVEKQCIIIADAMKKQNLEHENIDYWLKYKNNSVFREIQNLELMSC